MKTFLPGSRVRFTASFLGSTGQRNSGESSKRFTVIECSCSLCAGKEHVATDEKRSHAYLIATGYSLDEIADNPSLVWRHINVANLQLAR